MKIYHNPRCSKSREGLAILEASKVNFETIHYIETPISKEELIKHLEINIPTEIIIHKKIIKHKKYINIKTDNNEV